MSFAWAEFQDHCAVGISLENETRMDQQRLNGLYRGKGSCERAQKQSPKIHAESWEKLGTQKRSLFGLPFKENSKREFLIKIIKNKICNKMSQKQQRIKTP